MAGKPGDRQRRPQLPERPSLPDRGGVGERAVDPGAAGEQHPDQVQVGRERVPEPGPPPRRLASCLQVRQHEPGDGQQHARGQRQNRRRAATGGGQDPGERGRGEQPGDREGRLGRQVVGGGDAEYGQVAANSAAGQAE